MWVNEQMAQDLDLQLGWQGEKPRFLCLLVLIVVTEHHQSMGWAKIEQTCKTCLVEGFMAMSGVHVDSVSNELRPEPCLCLGNMMCLNLVGNGA